MPTAGKPPFTLVGIDDLERAHPLVCGGSRMPARLFISKPRHGAGMVRAALIVLWDITHCGARSAVPFVRGGRNVDQICLALSPFGDAEMRTHLSAHRVEFVREVFHGGARGMGNSFYVLDTWGNKRELKGPAIYPDDRSQRKSAGSHPDNAPPG